MRVESGELKVEGGELRVADSELQIEDCGLSEKWRVEDVECRIES